MKAIVLGASHPQVLQFLQKTNMNSREIRFFHGDFAWELNGLHWDTPVFLLEGYQNNPEYDLINLHLLGLRFINIEVIPERVLYE